MHLVTVVGIDGVVPMSHFHIVADGKLLYIPDYVYISLQWFFQMNQSEPRSSSMLFMKGGLARCLGTAATIMPTPIKELPLKHAQQEITLSHAAVNAPVEVWQSGRVLCAVQGPRLPIISLALSVPIGSGHEHGQQGINDAGISQLFKHSLFKVS